MFIFNWFWQKIQIYHSNIQINNRSPPKESRAYQQWTQSKHRDAQPLFRALWCCCQGIYTLQQGAYLSTSWVVCWNYQRNSSWCCKILFLLLIRKANYLYACKNFLWIQNRDLWIYQLLEGKIQCNLALSWQNRRKNWSSANCLSTEYLRFCHVWILECQDHRHNNQHFYINRSSRSIHCMSYWYFSTLSSQSSTCLHRDRPNTSTLSLELYICGRSSPVGIDSHQSPSHYRYGDI